MKQVNIEGRWYNPPRPRKSSPGSRHHRGGNRAIIGQGWRALTVGVHADLASRAESAIIAPGKDRDMAKIPVEIGQSFHKTGSHWVVWTLDSFNRSTKPVHARLTSVNDPTTHIIVSIDVLGDPRHFRRTVDDR